MKKIDSDQHFIWASLVTLLLPFQVKPSKKSIKRIQFNETPVKHANVQVIHVVLFLWSCYSKRIDVLLLCIQGIVSMASQSTSLMDVVVIMVQKTRIFLNPALLKWQDIMLHPFVCLIVPCLFLVSSLSNCSQIDSN